MKKLLLVTVLAVGLWALGQEPQTPSFNLRVTGEKTWTLRWGFGSASLLSGEKLPAEQLVLTQTLRADIEGTALDFLTLKASFNDQLGPGFQDFIILADKAPWKGELGRFVVGAEGDALGVYNKRVLGIRGQYTGEGFSVQGLLARLEGISDSRVFRGEQGLAEVEFAYEDPFDPLRPAPYTLSLDGLTYWPLRQPFVEGLTRVRLAFRDAPELWRFLDDWGLGFLEQLLKARLTTDLREGQYVVLDDEPNHLALRIAPRALLRQRLQELIDEYNKAEGLTGKDKKSYPFAEESELDVQFLLGLGPWVALQVDEELYPLPEGRSRRFLALGEPNVLAEGVEVWIRLPGQEAFLPSTDPQLADFQWKVHPAPGVLEIEFPEAFFQSGAGLRVKFAYRREGVSFGLGLSVVPGSERVYLNGKLLIRDVDYSIDYEAGLLLLFPTLGPEDVLQVDFERQRGALGVPTEYERYFLGVELTVPGWDGLRLGLYRALDTGTPQPTSRTMPNTHTIATASLMGQVADWEYRLTVGGSQNVFPSDDNARLPMPNRVNAVTAVQALDGAYVVLAHQNGLTVFKDGAFASYGSGLGLGGRAALALLPLPGLLLVGTEAGLTLVTLGDARPFDRVRNWVRLYPEDWNKERPLEARLQGKAVLALAAHEGRVWLATDKELVAFERAQVQNTKEWQKIPWPAEDVRPTALLALPEGVYIGTDQGLYLLSGERWTRVEGVPGSVRALARRERDVLVATDQGVQVVREGAAVDWIVYGKAVYSLAVAEVLWWAAEDGLWKQGQVEPVVRGKVTAVGEAGGDIWAGGEADANFQLRIWRVGERVETFEPRQTKIDGRDTGSFRDIPAAEHTRVGFTGSLVLSRALGEWQWQVLAFSRLPGYEEIGRGGRSDSHGLGLTASFSSEPMSLNFRLRWDVSELTTRPTAKLSGNLDGQWSGSPTLAVSLTPTLSGEGLWNWSKFETGWRASVAHTATNFSWSLGGSGNLVYPAFAFSADVQAKATWRPIAGWTMEGTWSRPFRAAAARGDETFTLSLTGTETTRERAWTLGGQVVLRHALGTDQWTPEYGAQGSLQLPTQRWGATEVAPRLNASWRSTPGEERLSSTLSATVVQAPATLSFTVNLGQSYRPATQRLERTWGLSAGWDHSGWDGIRPSLRWDHSVTVLTHPRYPEQVTTKDEVVLRLSMEPERAGWRNSLTVTWRPSESRLSLNNRFQWNLPSGALTADATTTLKEAAWEGKANVQIGVPLDAILRVLGARAVGENWAFNAEAAFLWGSQPGQAPEFAVALGATLAARF